QVMTPAEPAHVLLKLLRVIQEAWMPPLSLRNGCDPQSAEPDLRHTVHVRKIRRKTRETQIVNDLQPHQRTVPWVVIPGVSPAEFVDQVGLDRIRVRGLNGARIARLPPGADCGERVVEVARVRTVPNVSSEDEVFLGEPVIQPRRPVGIWVEWPQKLQP